MKIKKFILDTIFPIYCLSCQKEGVWLCRKCQHKIILKTEQTCPICKKAIVPNGETCFSCKHETSLDGILVTSFYRKNKERTLLAVLIHYYKYRFIKTIGSSLGKILEKSILSSSLPLPDTIISVPLHKRRLRWRGFNQSEVLAFHLSKNLTPGFSIPVLKDTLIRNRYTKPQAEIKNKENRKVNTLNAFTIAKENLSFIKEKNIFLIDDIVTTGSTLAECAKELKKAGAKKVYGIVLARQ